MVMCHMLADSLDELHAMASKIGLKREWFQPKSTPHYDVSLTKRKQALEQGAQEIDRAQVVALTKQWRIKHASLTSRT